MRRYNVKIISVFLKMSEVNVGCFQVNQNLLRSRTQKYTRNIARSEQGSHTPAVAIRGCNTFEEICLERKKKKKERKKDK